MRRAYIVLSWPTENLGARAEAARIAGRLDDDRQWRRVGASDGLDVWTGESAPLAVRSLPMAGGFLIGEVFDHPGATRMTSAFSHDASTSLRTPRDLARALVQRHWGQYVAILQGPRPSEKAAFRDPTGMLDCMTWSLGEGIEIVASDMTQAPKWLRPRWPALNWDRITEFMSAPAAASTPSLFDDIEVVGPGELLALGPPPRRPEVIWSPVAFAAQPAERLEDVRRELVSRLDRCTADLLGGYDRVLVELSGGLDSSVVAGAIDAVGFVPKVAEWFNAVNSRPEANESRYARAVTDRLGVTLETFNHPPIGLEVADFAEVAQAFWPASGALDAQRDRIALARVRATGAQAIVSGQGGDAAFFQMPSPLVAADEFHRRGWSSLASPVLAGVARRTRQSVWTVLGQVHAARRGQLPEQKLVSSVLSASAKAATVGVDHAWVTQAHRADLPPGKRFHIRVMANTHLNHVASRRRREADLLFPLLAQPIMELCLAVPTPDLAGGSFDRPFERATFAHRIPDLVLQRRAKGNLSVYFSRLVAASLPSLRPYLLDGVLCDAGVLDRQALERILDPNQLIWAATATDILWAAMVEAWVRYWQTQVPDALTASRRRA
jgi:asparagine synthase (glutamine-hydrolysing)